MLSDSPPSEHKNNESDENPQKFDNNKDNSEQILEKIMKDEKRIHSFIIKQLPLIVIASLVVFWIFTYGDNEHDFVFYLITTIGFAAPFFLIHRKCIFKAKEMKKTKSANPYFLDLTYERAFLRIYNLDKFYKLSIILLIVVALFIGIGLHYTNQSIEENRKYYAEKLDDYYQEQEKINDSNDEHLKEFIIEKIFGSSYSKKYFLEKLYHDELILEAERNLDSTLKNNAWDVAGVKVNELTITDIESEINNKINSMNYKQLLEYSQWLSLSKPSSYYYENEDGFKQFNFLLSLAFLPGSMFYSVFLYKQFFRQKDFFYHLSIASFKFLANINSSEEIMKREYLKLGIENYEKFLKKTINMKFNKIHDILSNFLIITPSTIDEENKKILEKLEKDHNLSLAEYLGKYRSNSSKNSIESSILVIDPLIDKIKEPLPLIATVVSSVIGIVGFFLTVVLQISSNAPT